MYTGTLHRVPSSSCSRNPEKRLYLQNGVTILTEGERHSCNLIFLLKFFTDLSPVKYRFLSTTVFKYFIAPKKDVGREGYYHR